MTNREKLKIVIDALKKHKIHVSEPIPPSQLEGRPLQYLLQSRLMLLRQTLAVEICRAQHSIIEGGVGFDEIRDDLIKQHKYFVDF